MGDERKWSRNDKIALCSLLVAIVGCVAALIVVPELRHSLGLDESSSSGVNRSSVNSASSRTSPMPSNRTENSAQPPVIPLPTADSGLVKRLSPDASPDSSYLDFGRILRVGLPEHFSSTNPHHVAQYATLLYKEGDEEALLKSFSFVRKDRHFTLDMMYPSTPVHNELLAFRGDIIYLEFVGFEEQENYTRWYYFLVNSSGNSFQDNPWIEVVRSKDSGNCLLRTFEPNGHYHAIPKDDVTRKR